MIDTPYGYLRFLLPVVLHYCVVEECIPDDYLEIRKSNPDPLWKLTLFEEKSDRLKYL
jgi:hypothetical protein